MKKINDFGYNATLLNDNNIHKNELESEDIICIYQKFNVGEVLFGVDDIISDGTIILRLMILVIIMKAIYRSLYSLSYDIYEKS